MTFSTLIPAADLHNDAVTTSAERARGLARRLWEASSEDRSKEVVRAYTETAGEALEAFILAFEQAKRREVRM